MMRGVAVLTVVASAAAAPMSSELAEFFAREHFKGFEARFGKTYGSVAEREYRFSTFVSNLEDVVVKNAALEAVGAAPVHGVTKFADWTKDEFEAMVGGVKGLLPDQNATVVATPTVKEAPSKLDWRDHGVVTPVKDQGRCGSCWAHSAVETIESRRAVLGEELVALSVQQLVSCDTKDQGCNGGWYYTAWDKYVAKAGGLASEADYPYDNRTYWGMASACAEPQTLVQASDVGDYSWATTPCKSLFCNYQDEDMLKQNLASYGPVSIACDASDWASYAGGVLTKESCKSSDLKLDHAIQLVGYNEDADVPYWIVRNSWATDWGEDGYIYLKMGENTCGIADKAALVAIDAAIATA